MPVKQLDFLDKGWALGIAGILILTLATSLWGIAWAQLSQVELQVQENWDAYQNNKVEIERRLSTEETHYMQIEKQLERIETKIEELGTHLRVSAPLL